MPLGSLLFVAQYHRADANTTYPDFHELLLLPLYAVAFAGYWVMGGISHISTHWPYGLRNVSGFFTVLIVITNIVAAIMGVLLLRFGSLMVDRQRRWLWFGLLFIGFNGVFVYYSRVGNLDIAYNFWWAVAWFFLWEYLIRGKPVRYSLIPAGIAAACATGSKDQASALAIGGGITLLLFAPEPHTPFRRRVRNGLIYAAAVVGAYVVVAILPQPVRWWNHARFVVGPHAPTKIPFSPIGELEIFVSTLRQLIEVFTIPVLALCAIGAFDMLRSRRVREFWTLMVPLIVYYVIIIGKTRVVYPRFMIPFIIPVLVFSTYGVAYIGDRLKKRRAAEFAWVGLLAAFLVVQFAFNYLPVTFAQVVDLKREVAKDLPSLVPPGSPILTARMQSYNYPNRSVYDKYELMMLPGDRVIPTSEHAESIFHPLDPEVQYYLLGTGTAGHPSQMSVDSPQLRGELIRQWRYPDWVRNHVVVPCIYEFSLYRRTGPLPMNFRSIHNLGRMAG